MRKSWILSTSDNWEMLLIESGDFWLESWKIGRDNSGNIIEKERENYSRNGKLLFIYIKPSTRTMTRNELGSPKYEKIWMSSQGTSIFFFSRKSLKVIYHEVGLIIFYRKVHIQISQQRVSPSCYSIVHCLHPYFSVNRS